MNKRLTRVTSSLLFLVFCALASSLTAAVPELVAFQGRLTDSNGQPVPDGQYDLTFTIYDAPQSGVAWWTETQGAVPVVDGVFSVVLGSTEPLLDTVFSGADRYLEVIVDGTILEPRTRFTSSAYAQRIGAVDGAKGGTLFGGITVVPGSTPDSIDAIVVQNDLGIRVMDVVIDSSGLPSISLYEPVDSKDVMPSKILGIVAGGDGRASLSFYDPIDSKFNLLAEPPKRVELTHDGLVMFGETESDTSLIVGNNGDIRGLGQITMGQNSSDGTGTSVLGFNNTASGDSSTVGGGSFNVASGTSSTISGGFGNEASGTGTTIGGGGTNVAGGEYATIGGGKDNRAEGDYSAIAGGFDNIAFGQFATIAGGKDNRANGDYSFAAGRRAQAEHVGAFVWADSTPVNFPSTAPNQFIIRAGGGVGIGTNSPQGILEVAGDPGDEAVILPEGAIANAEILDEPGLASTSGGQAITLVQGSGTMRDIAVVSITIPADGYILVRGSATLETSGTTGPNRAFVQIDEMPMGALINGQYALAGAGDHASAAAMHYFSVGTEAVYMRTAGTYEFRLEALADDDNGDGAVTSLSNTSITAVYLPTAYGGVSSLQ